MSALLPGHTSRPQPVRLNLRVSVTSRIDVEDSRLPDALLRPAKRSSTERVTPSEHPAIGHALARPFV